MQSSKLPKLLTFNFSLLTSTRGSSLVEVLLVIATIGFLVLLLANLPNSINLITYSGNQSLAREIASKTIEDTRATPFNNLGNGETNISDPRISRLPGGLGKKNIQDCEPTICTNAELTKKLTVTIEWQESGKQKSLVINTFVSEGGLK